MVLGAIAGTLLAGPVGAAMGTEIGAGTGAVAGAALGGAAGNALSPAGMPSLPTNGIQPTSVAPSAAQTEVIKDQSTAAMGLLNRNGFQQTAQADQYRKTLGGGTVLGMGPSQIATYQPGQLTKPPQL